MSSPRSHSSRLCAPSGRRGRLRHRGPALQQLEVDLFGYRCVDIRPAAEPPEECDRGLAFVRLYHKLFECTDQLLLVREGEVVTIEGGGELVEIGAGWCRRGRR